VLHGVLHILGFDHETDEDYEVMWSHESIMRENLLLTN
jgi:ssRNA-specific RNase YbeY (16S rRNA maturation enzyme)